MELIRREELKTAIRNFGEVMMTNAEVIKIIDKQDEIKIDEGYIEELERKVNESRPKGEWRINDSFWGTSNPYCSRCGREIEPEVRYAIGLPPFCFDCGADMRGE